ncbi:MAG: YicC/YloC family endoribonuclease [Thermodesulfobacteriota bacterium]
MIKSMTGYGRATQYGEGWSLTWEVKSVNSKFLDIKWRTPQNLMAFQPEWENILRANALRGRVDARLDLRIQSREFVTLRLNTALAAQMLAELNKLAIEEKIAYQPDLNRLLQNPQVWQEGDDVPVELVAGIRQGLKQCLQDWNESRAGEGRKMAEDILSRLRELQTVMSGLKEMAGENSQNRFAALRSRLEKTMKQLELGEVDEGRLCQELAIMSDRLDVSEELTRLESHLEEMNNLLEAQGEIGRKLDFLLQECFREITTCGNKCQNSSMSHQVVDFKAELEKCREQAQNIE